VAANTQLLFPESLGISSVGDKLNKEGELTDRGGLDQLIGWLARFVAFVADSDTRANAA
jgi:hypothetical protein